MQIFALTQPQAAKLGTYVAAIIMTVIISHNLVALVTGMEVDEVIFQNHPSAY